MKRFAEKTWLLTLALYLMFLQKGYSIGDQTQVVVGEVLYGNVFIASISPFLIFHNQVSPGSRCSFFRTNFVFAYHERLGYTPSIY
jgi:hypothetical protein